MEKIELLQTLLDIENEVLGSRGDEVVTDVRWRIVNRMLQTERDLRKAQADILDEASEAKP